MTMLVATVASIAVLLIAVSLPMAMGAVKPNWLYGFRTAKTMSNPEIWYPANRKAGINMVAAGVLELTVLGAMLLFYSARTAGMVSLVLLPVLVIAAGLVSLAQTQTM